MEQDNSPKNNDNRAQESPQNAATPISTPMKQTLPLNSVPLQGEGAASRGLRGEQKWFSAIETRLRAIEGVLRRGDKASAGMARAKDVRSIPDDFEEPVEETSQADELILDLVKWLRRLLIPLALLAWAGIVILIVWAFGHISRTILVLIIAAVLAYALAPLVTFVERAVPRLLAILLVYLIVLGGISILLYLVISTAVGEVDSLSTFVAKLLTPESSTHISPLERTLNSFGVSSEQVTTIRNQLIASTEGLAGNVVPVLTGVFNGALDVVVVAVLSIYLLIDGDRITRWFRSSMPRRQRGRVRFLLVTLQRIVGGYIRGQLLMSALIGVLVGGGMALFRVPYALLLGILAFVLAFIPILGTFISGALCVLLALTKGWILAIIVLAYFIGVHVIEGDVVGPRIVGRAVGLHPIVSLLAVIAGGELFGIWGILFASPIAGIVQAFLVAIWSEWREMHPGEFQAVKNRVAQGVEENIADKPVEPEPAAKLLSEDE